MRKGNWFSVSLLALGVGAASVNGFSQAPNNPAAPMSEPIPDMGHKSPASMVPTGPLKINFGDKSENWTAVALAALPHTTLTV